MRTAGTVLFLFALVLVIITRSVPFVAEAAPKASQTPAPPAICSTADVVAMLGKNGALQNDRYAAIQFIQARIAACKSAINEYVAGLSPEPVIARNPPGLPPLPAPAPMTTPPPGCRVSVPDTKEPSAHLILLYSALTYCVNWVAKNVSSPSTTPTPQPIAFHTPAAGSKDTWDKAIYVLALASDPLLSAQITNQLADKLRSDYMLRPAIQYGQTPPPIPDIYSDRLVRYNVVAAPGWTLERYQQQCFNDPSTAGAIVALQPGIASQLFSLIVNFSQTFVNMQLMVIDCEPTNTAYVKNAAYITYLSHVRTQHTHRLSGNLSTILGGVALALAFSPTTTTTYTITPKKPIPKNTPLESGYTVATNFSNAGVAGATIAGLTPYSALGEQPSGEQQTQTSITKLLPDLIGDLLWPCTQLRPNESSFAQPQCDWFPYRRPPPTVRSQ